MPTTYTPSAADANFNAFVGQPFDDPVTYSSADNKRADSKYFFKPVQDELLYLISKMTDGVFALPVRNETGAQLDANTLVYISGYSSGESRWLVSKAHVTTSPQFAQFVLLTAIANTSNGLAHRYGRSTGLNTAAASTNDAVYLSSTAGGYELTSPANDSEHRQIVGRVEVSDATGGVIRWELPGTGRADMLQFPRATGRVPTAPSALTGNTNDWDFGTAGIIAATTNGSSYNVTGLANGYNGRELLIRNTHATACITLTDEDGSSTAANRIICPYGDDLVLEPGAYAYLYYDYAATRWRVVGSNGYGLRTVTAYADLTAGSNSTINVTGCYGARKILGLRAWITASGADVGAATDTDIGLAIFDKDTCVDSSFDSHFGARRVQDLGTFAFQSRNLNADVNNGVSSLTVDSNAGISEDDLVIITDGTDYEYQRVASLTGTTTLGLVNTIVRNDGDPVYSTGEDVSRVLEWNDVSYRDSDKTGEIHIQARPASGGDNCRLHVALLLEIAQ